MRRRGEDSEGTTGAGGVVEGGGLEPRQHCSVTKRDRGRSAVTETAMMLVYSCNVIEDLVLTAVVNISLSIRV